MLPVALDGAAAAVVVAPVVAAVILADAILEFEETDAVTAPAPSPTPLATGTVVTVERVLDEVMELLEVDATVEDADAVVEDAEDAEDDDSDEELDELPSILMLCHDPDISPYTYSAPPVE